MKAVKSTGLVPITFEAPWGRYHKGDIGGVRPADVAPILAGRFGAMAQIPDDVETIEVTDADIVAILVAPQAPTRRDQERERMAAVEIPDDWRSQHHLQRLKIAALIRGAKVDTVELADATIQDELTRRGESVSRFGIDNVALGNLANQGDGGTFIPVAGAVAAAVASAPRTQPEPSKQAAPAAKSEPVRS